VRASAELIEDAGAAAAGAEFFRSAEFMAAEGVTHTLRVSAERAELLAPLLVREIPGSQRLDAVSPYGYPGFAAPAGLELDPDEVDWSATGLVSVFVRHRVGGPALAGASARNQLQIADPALPAKSRPSDRQQIRRNLERGYKVRLVEGRSASDVERAGFLAAYEETMRRAGADRRYFFSGDYFARILACEAAWLLLALDAAGEVAAGSIATRSDGLLHYYLSGTAERYLEDSPMKNIVAKMVEFAAEQGLRLNLGGGLRPGDALEEFKRGFANRTEPFRTSEIVSDRAAYEELTAGSAPASFFPAYRAP
jgi:hypothetical protein